MSSDNPEISNPEPGRDAEIVPRPVPQEKVIVIGRPEEGEWVFAGPRPRPRYRLALALFIATCLSTFVVGFLGDGLPALFHFKPEELRVLFTRQLSVRIGHGVLYTCCLMAILSAHELGHYLQARRYGVPASLPLFIPFPISPIGTMGAVIVQRPGVADRKAMFDIAISGPLAGLVVAVPLAWWGIATARFNAPLPGPSQSITVFSSPLLLTWIGRLVHGPMASGHMSANPALFAGWVGFFITALNLIPIGQLDGGHILYCLIGKTAHLVARGLFLLAAGTVALSIFFGDGRYAVWTAMLFLILLIGTRHPPTANDRVPLGTARRVLGTLTLLFVFIGLTPTPVYEIEARPAHRPQVRAVDEVNTDRAP
jgi:membrane-associated protease RseP (regulator of RpoE activity)